MADYTFENVTGQNATIQQVILSGSKIFKSIEYLDNGASVADNYIIEVIGYNDPAPGYIRVRITTGFPNNPYSALETPLPADGITEVIGIGLKVVVEEIANIASNAKVNVIVGSLTNFGIIPSGESSDPIPIYIKNTSGGVLVQNVLKLVNKPQLTNLVGQPVIKLNPNGTSNPIPATYTITFVGYTGLNPVCQVSVDGGPPSSDKIIVVDDVTWNSNVIDGLSMVFNSGLSDTHQAEIEVSDATDYVEVVQDILGVPGVSWGLGPITLTEIDGNVPGRIDEDQRARFWIRYIVPETANSDRNMRQFAVLVTGQVI